MKRVIVIFGYAIVLPVAIGYGIFRWVIHDIEQVIRECSAEDWGF